MHEDEYHDGMITMLELIWGEGYMAPGGPGNVRKMVEGLDLRGKRVLDIGCGLGGPACELAAEHGARVLGIDIEARPIELARCRASALGLADRVEFRLVEPGPLPCAAESIDIVLSAGAFTQIEDKRGIFAECRRVLVPGGAITCYDWTTPGGELSQDMRYWIELEGLTYAMQTPEHLAELLAEAGFVEIETADGSGWYRAQARREYERMKGPLYPRMCEALGVAQADHFVENWRAMVVVCGKGEMGQTYCRARKETAV